MSDADSIDCGTDCCPPKAAIAARELLTGRQALELAGIFKIIANDTRIRLLHALVREGELCVGDLAARVGMAPQAVSNQLQRMTDRGIVGARRDGVRMCYRIIDPCVVELLDKGQCLAEDSRMRMEAGIA